MGAARLMPRPLGGRRGNVCIYSQLLATGTISHYLAFDACRPSEIAMSHHDHDLYLKLRPPPATPPDELCRCPGHPSIKLMCALSYNPLHCLDCNLEIEPVSLPLPIQLVEPIAAWRSNYDAIYRLWLASGDYEDWAEAQLSDITSPINVDGIRLCAQLDPVRRCYFWYFQAESADCFTPLTHCPNCGNGFSAYHRGIFAQYICEQCRIATVGA